MTDEGWVGDVYRPKAQRNALLCFAEVIGAKRKLGEDEAGNPRIEGRFGHVYVKPATTETGRRPIFQLYVTGGEQRIRFAKDALSFGRITNKGDEDMLVELALDGLIPSQGEIIRDKLGIFKRVTYSEEVLARKRESVARMVAQKSKNLDGSGPE